MSESKYKCRVVALLKKELEDAWVYHPSDKFVSGIPDLLVLYRGVFAAIELKFMKGKATKLQVIMLSRIEKAGGMAEIRAVLLAIKARANGGNNEGHA